MIPRPAFPPARARLLFTALVGLGLLTLGGCATRSTRYVAPSIPLPAQFSRPVPELPADADASAAAGDSSLRLAPPQRLEPPPPLDPARLREWWRLLGDSALDSLVDRALANNLELHIATARLEQAWARSHQAQAARYPVVSLGYEGIAQKPNDTSVGQINTSGTSTYHVLQLSMSLNLDVWGERSATAESATLQLWRTSLEREDVRRGVISSTVSLYIDYLSLNDRIRIAHDTEKAQHDMLESVQGRMKGGEATITDYEQQRAAVNSVAATIPVLELQRANAENALALLLGVPPSALSLPADRGLAALTFPSALPTMPPQLLLGRPDVHAAEMRLRAASADIDAARARLLPRVDLTAQAGYGAQWLSGLFSPSGFYWNGIANVVATIFDHGARADDVAYADAYQEELIEAYVQALYAAIRETEDALAAVQFNNQRLASQRVASEAAHNAWVNSSEAYAAGAIDYLTLLDTERTYFNNLDTLHAVVRDRYKGLVSLFAAVGGGTTVDPGERKSVASDGDGDGDASAADAASASDARQAKRLAAADPAPADSGAFMVAIAGLQDNDGVDRVTRDLWQRFPAVMAERHVVARQYGRIGDQQVPSTAWYRLYVAGFATQDDAQRFCATLSSQMQRCEVMSSTAAPEHDGIRRLFPVSAHAE